MKIVFFIWNILVPELYQIFGAKIQIRYACKTLQNWDFWRIF